MLNVFELFCLYFLLLLIFSITNHAIYSCILLVTISLVGGLICYTVYGFSWYSVLFCLVYIGGVYILFIFTSVFRPKNNLAPRNSFTGLFMTVFSFALILAGNFVFYDVLNVEYREYICTMAEGRFYVCLCMVLVFGFIMLRMVVRLKINRFR